MSGWKPLKKGDVVDIVAPGFRCTDDGLEGAKKYIESLGLVPRVPADIFGEDLICSNSDKLRLQHLKKALYSRDSAAVWCVRGGYGLLRLIPEIAKWKKPSVAKLFIGYSDVTTLNSLMTSKWKWPVLHGPLLDRLGSGKASPSEVHLLNSVIFGSIDKVQFTNLKPMNEKARRAKVIRGKVTGGNLTVLASSLGTRQQHKPKGQILFFEDWGERAYRIDRMIQQMSQAGYFNGVKAIVLGDFLGGNDLDGNNRVWPLWSELASQMKIPVFCGLKAGHGEVQLTVPLGTSSVLRVEGNEATLSCATGAK